MAGSARSTAPAAAQVAARAASNVQSMSAQRCLTAWKCPMGRPNCSRTRAYSAAVSTHHAAAPTASAAASRPAMPVTPAAPAGHSSTSLGSTRSESARTRAGRRVRSTPTCCSSDTESAATTIHRSTDGSVAVTGSTSTVARAAPSTGSHVPSTTTAPSSSLATTGMHPTPTPAHARPSARTASSSRARPPEQNRSIADDATTVDRNGPGVHQRPSSSSTTASSRMP